MHKQAFWVVAALVSTTTLSAAAWAQAEWRTYRNTELGFSVETPGDPQLETKQIPTAVGATPALFGLVGLGDRGAMMFSVADYTTLVAGRSYDIDKGLEGAVQGEVANMHAVLDSETTITVDGQPGREIVAHTDTIAIRSRLTIRALHLYNLMAAGPAKAGVPAEFTRFEQSFAFVR